MGVLHITYNTQKVDMDAGANMEADTGVTTIAHPEVRSGKLKQFLLSRGVGGWGLVAVRREGGIICKF